MFAIYISFTANKRRRNQTGQICQPFVSKMRYTNLLYTKLTACVLEEVLWHVAYSEKRVLIGFLVRSS